MELPKVTCSQSINEPYGYNLKSTGGSAVGRGAVSFCTLELYPGSQSAQFSPGPGFELSTAGLGAVRLPRFEYRPEGRKLKGLPPLEDQPMSDYRVCLSDVG